jgi:VanZ like family
MDEGTAGTLPSVTLQEIRDYVGGVAWFWPGLLVTIAAAILFGRRVARAIRAPRFLGTGLVLSVGLVVASTLTPSLRALRFGVVSQGTCDVSSIGPPSLAELATLSDTSLNVALFLPLGLVLGLLPRTSPRLVPIVSAFVLPFLIELTQLLVRPLDRACQTSDVSNNLTGLAIGLLIGVVVRRLARAPSNDEASRRDRRAT